MGTDRQRGIPGVLMLDMTRTGGKRYTPGETERIIHDGFIVQVPMAFEDYTYLSVDRTARLLSAHSDGAGHGDLLLSLVGHISDKAIWRRAVSVRRPLYPENHSLGEWFSGYGLLLEPGP